MRDLSKALISLYPGTQWSLNGDSYDGLEWYDNDKPKPSKEELEAECDRLHQLWLNNEYQRQRQPEYPSLADFADAYYWASKGDNTKMNEYITKCDTVKDKYPKP